MCSPASLFVTVVMPVHNEEHYIERSLGAVLAQDYPADRMEVLVVDGMSDDRTREIVTTFGGKGGVRIIDNPGRIVATGLNRAIPEARGSIVVRVDGHCEIASDYVRRSVELLATGDHAGVGGVIETVGETDVARTIAVAMSSHFGVGGSAFRTGRSRPIDADTVPFPAYPKSVLDEAGPYDEELVRNQDDEYNYRLRHTGRRLLLHPGIRSRYWSRARLGSLWRQYYQYGVFKVRVMQKHPAQMRARQLVPPLFVAAVVAAALCAVWSSWGRLLLAAIGGPYVLMNLAASAWAARRAPWKTAALLPFVFAILHFSFGLGFWHGLVRFASRWR